MQTFWLFSSRPMSQNKARLGRCGPLSEPPRCSQTNPILGLFYQQTCTGAQPQTSFRLLQLTQPRDDVQTLSLGQHHHESKRWTTVLEKIFDKESKSPACIQSQSLTLCYFTKWNWSYCSRRRLNTGPALSFGLFRSPLWTVKAAAFPSGFHTKRSQSNEQKARHTTLKTKPETTPHLSAPTGSWQD